MKFLVTAIKEAIKNNTAMVSVIYVNNEVGTISDVAENCRKLCIKKGIAIHSDLTQAIGKNADEMCMHMGLDFHHVRHIKIYGSERNREQLLLRVMRMEFHQLLHLCMVVNRRMVSGQVRWLFIDIVGFKAAEIAHGDSDENEKRILRYDKMLVEGLMEIDGISLTNQSDKRLPGIISIIVDKNDFNNERFIKHISDRLALSTGSACSAGEPSYVITALGLENKVSKVLRLSLNKHTTEEEINQLIMILREEL